MIPSPTSVSTLVCLSAESKPETITIFEPQLNHEIIRRRPTQITKEKSQASAGFNPLASQNTNKAVNALVKGLEVAEFSILVKELEKLVLKLTETIQSTTSFQPFWDNETISNEKIRTALDSLMHLIGFESQDGQYFSNDVEDVTKKAIEMKKLVQLFQSYYTPFGLETFKPNLLHCFKTEDLANKAYMVIKLKNVEDRLGDIKLSVTDKSLNVSKGITTLTGDFNLVYSNQNQGDDMNSFIDRITKHVRKGENMMLLSVGATGSGKSETFFKSVGVKRDKGERIDEAVVLQMFERLIDQEAQEDKDTIITQFECQYVQIFNENLFDLLKKKDEKEEAEEPKQTNLQWLKSSIDNCTRIEITDKLSIRKIMKRASTNRALLTVQDKIFERRSIYMLKCFYKIMIGNEEKTAEIVFCEMPGIEKLTKYEKESLKNMNAANNLFASKDEFTEFMVQTYPSRKNTMLMKMLDLNFLRNCEMIIVSHLSLDREAFEENVTLFRFLKHFNETISICKQSKDQLSTEQDLLSLFTKYEEIRKMLSDHSYPHFSLHKTTCFLKHLEDLQEDILSKCLRLSPAQLKSTLSKISELANIAKVLEVKPRYSKALMIKETRKKGLQSLNEIISISDSITITPNQVSKSHSSPTKLSKNQNLKPKKFTVSQDPLYKYIDELVEIDLGLYKNKLSTEGRCAVCTLKNCQSHSKHSGQISVSSKPSERLDRTINGSFREPSKIRTSLKLKDASYDAENVNPTPTRTSIQSYNVPIPSRRQYRRAGSLQCEPVIVRDMNLDKSLNDIEMKSKVNQSMTGSMIELENENMKLEDMNNARLAKQLKLEEYHEKKILESLRNLKEKRMQEELQKRETDVQEEKKKKYFEGQKKRLEEMRKVKVEEKKREKVEIEQREIEEMKKKKKADQYYRKIKERLVSYQNKKIAEIMLAAENMAQGIHPVQVAQILEESEEQYESIFTGKQEDKLKAPVVKIVNKTVSCPTSAQKEIIEEDILNISKGNASAEILDEEIVEESIAA